MGLQRELDIAVDLGKQLGKHPVFIDRFLLSFGSSLFTQLGVCDRIDFLYNPKLHKHRDQSMFASAVEIGITKGVPWITDADGRYGKLSAAYLKDNDEYSIRLFSKKASDFHPFFKRDWHGEPPNLQDVIGANQKQGEVRYLHVMEQSDYFWNFRRENNTIEAYHRSQGFLDIGTTRDVANILVWVTNMLEFS